MNLSKAIKPISYFQSNAPKIIEDLSRNEGTMIITYNGEAKAVLQDIHAYEKIQESLALLKILAMGNRQIEQGKIHSVDEAFADIEAQMDRDFPE